MNTEYTRQEIIWRTKSTNVDIETGEIIPQTEIHKYTKLRTKTEKHVYRNTGSIRHTNECRKNKYRQQEIFTNSEI